MRLYELPRRDIDRFGSAGVSMDFLPAVRAVATDGTADQGTGVHVAHLAAGGTLGRHPATRRQLFAVASGHARVAVDDGDPVDLREGQCALWETGEVHQTWAVSDVVAVVVETDGEVELTEHHRVLR